LNDGAPSLRTDGSGWEEAERWDDLAEQNGDAGETLFDLFQSASDGPDRLKQHVQGMTRHVRTRKHKRARNVTLDTSSKCGSPDGARRNWTDSEIKLLDLSVKRGLPIRHVEEMLEMMRSPGFNISDIRCSSFRNLLLRLEDDQDSEPEFQCFNLWKEGDGVQKVELYIRDLKSVFLEILTHADVGELDLFFRAIIDHSGNRWYTAHANSGTWWEDKQRRLGSDVAVGAALLYFDGTHIKQNIGVQGCYRKSKRF